MIEVDLKDITVDSFRPYVGHTFQFLDEATGTQVALELAEMEEKRFKAASSDHREPFSLFFRGPEKFYRPQGIHVLEHSEMGRLKVFMVPLQPDEKGSLYQVVFN